MVGFNTDELARLTDGVHSKNLVNTHSVLIAKENKLVLETYLDKRLETYLDERLLAPSITNYINLTNDTKTIPYFGSGMPLTLRDKLKFGQFYLNGGTWNGKRIISKNWVQESFIKHTRLRAVRDKNEYEYFWYHDITQTNQ